MDGTTSPAYPQCTGRAEGLTSGATAVAVAESSVGCASCFFPEQEKSIKAMARYVVLRVEVHHDEA